MNSIRSAVLGATIASFTFLPFLTAAQAQETKKPPAANAQAPASQQAATQPKDAAGKKAKMTKEERKKARAAKKAGKSNMPAAETQTQPAAPKPAAQR